MNNKQKITQAKLIISTSKFFAFIFALLISIVTFWYPLNFFLKNDITSWIGFPVTIMLCIFGVIIGAYPLSYISKQRKDKIGFFGNLQTVIDSCDNNK